MEKVHEKLCASWNRHKWERIKLRKLSYAQVLSLENQFLHMGTYGLYEPSSREQFLLHRLVLLLWINEVELAKEFWERNKYVIMGGTFEETLFNLVICEMEGPSWGYIHPEFDNLVRYYLLSNNQSFFLSTIPLYDLLHMDEPHFSSIDGLITVNFDKYELERITKIVPEKYHKKLRLPLILLSKDGGYINIGTKMENMLLQKLLKLTDAPFEKFNEIEERKEIESISMLNRRHFSTIYKILPEKSSIWLSVIHEPSSR